MAHTATAIIIAARLQRHSRDAVAMQSVHLYTHARLKLRYIRDAHAMYIFKRFLASMQPPINRNCRDEIERFMNAPYVGDRC